MIIFRKYDKLLTKEQTVQLIDKLHEIDDLRVEFSGHRLYQIKDTGPLNKQALTHSVSEDFHKKFSELVKLSDISTAGDKPYEFIELCPDNGFSKRYQFNASYPRPLHEEEGRGAVEEEREVYSVRYSFRSPMLRGEDILSFGVTEIRAFMDSGFIFSGQGYTEQEIKSLLERRFIRQKDIDRLEPSEKYFVVEVDDCEKSGIKRRAKTLSKLLKILRS